MVIMVCDYCHCYIYTTTKYISAGVGFVLTFNSFMGADGLIDDLSLLLKFAAINLHEERKMSAGTLHKSLMEVAAALEE